MKLEVGKVFRTKEGELVKLIDKRSFETFTRYLGVIDNKNYMVVWYNEEGRLYYNGISPDDIDHEVITKLEFYTKFHLRDGNLTIEWPKQDIIKHLMGEKVKITVEYQSE